MRKKLEERIRRKEAEIQELEARLREARAYVQALQDTVKLLPRHSSDSGGESAVEDMLRPGGMVAAARNALLKRAKPMHLLDILTEIGREPSKANRASLGGSLSAYVRRGEIFTRPGPNTFGLVEFSEAQRPIEPPASFGRRARSEQDDDDDEIPF